MNKRFNSQEEFDAFLDSDEFADGLKKYLASLIEEHQTEISPVLENVAAFLEKFGSILLSAAQAIPPDTVEYLRSIYSAIVASPEDLLGRWKPIAELGWFPYPRTIIGADLLADAISKDSYAVEQFLINLFTEELPLIEKDLVDHYPERRHLISQGFDAHRQRQYGLSILMFLEQADGIAYDKLSKSVFMQKDRSTLHFDEIQVQPGVILEAFLLLFEEDSLPIWVSRNSRDGTFRGFNRHQVMHGETVDFDTEENSLKAVSFLCWLSCVLHLVEGN